jgi:aspartyl-tRNA(Asn)/glutamyl-tRNA(Gln) amidotransferase subunit C
MTREEIVHLATLSRIALTEEELTRFTKELSAILSYVGAVQELAGDETPSEPLLGDRHNIFRQDIVSNEPEAYTESILNEMPETEGRYLKVRKILQIE